VRARARRVRIGVADQQKILGSGAREGAVRATYVRRFKKILGDRRAAVQKILGDLRAAVPRLTRWVVP
jgi:hypothetical protein